MLQKQSWASDGNNNSFDQILSVWWTTKVKMTTFYFSRLNQEPIRKNKKLSFLVLCEKSHLALWVFCGWLTNWPVLRKSYGYKIPRGHDPLLSHHITLHHITLFCCGEPSTTLFKCCREVEIIKLDSPINVPARLKSNTQMTRKCKPWEHWYVCFLWRRGHSETQSNFLSHKPFRFVEQNISTECSPWI